MEKYRFKKDSSAKLKELLDDLVRFNEEWYQIKTEKKIIENQHFLSILAKDILKLDRHATEVASLEQYKSSAELIHYILHTPWGAPFVASRTLLEAAGSFEDEMPLQSSLHDLLKTFTFYSGKCDIPILESLKILKEELFDLYSFSDESHPSSGT